MSDRRYIIHITGSKISESFLDLGNEQIPEIRCADARTKNQELAKSWAKKKPPTSSSVQAAIFFDDNDELAVLTRDEKAEPFISSPCKKQLGRCLVYLDDAHTRGTDLNLPSNFRVAVTLGPKVTKDRLLQGQYSEINF